MYLAALPAYNEEKYISDVVSEVKKYVDEVIVVDDGSVDMTASLAGKAGAVVMRHGKNLGYGMAIQTILAEARERTFDALVIIDADTQHDPKDIPNLIKPILNGYDITIGARDSKDIPFYRQVGGKVLSVFTQILSGANVKDSQSGFRAFSMEAVKKLSPKETGMAVSSEVVFLAAKNGLKIKEVPISIKYTSDSSTHNPIYQGFYTLFKVLGMIAKKAIG